MNPLYLIDPDDCCEVCGTKLRDKPGETLNGCPWGPHTEDDYPKDAA